MRPLCTPPASGQACSRLDLSDNVIAHRSLLRPWTRLSHTIRHACRHNKRTSGPVRGGRSFLQDPRNALLCRICDAGPAQVGMKSWSWPRKEQHLLIADRQVLCISSAAASDSSLHSSEVWLPEAGLVMPEARGRGGAPASESVGYDEHKPRTPPPDLPSLLLDSRITYLGMPVRALNLHASTCLPCRQCFFVSA